MSESNEEIERVNRVLFAAAAIRMPTFDSQTHPTERVSKLEDHLLATAFHRGELEEARLTIDSALDLLLDQWDAVEGWEAVAGSRPTQDSIRRAKKALRPDLHDAVNMLKRLIKKLDRQIARLLEDDEVASRAYTLITGS